MEYPLRITLCVPHILQVADIACKLFRAEAGSGEGAGGRGCDIAAALLFDHGAQRTHEG
jgi:hypothetical protein